MAATGYQVFAEITNADADQAGTLIGTQVGAASSAALWWYLDKAGIRVDPTPTTGQGWPR